MATTTTGAYSYLFYKPVYTAFSKLIINSTTTNQEKLGNEEIDYGLIFYNVGLINTYLEIMKSPAIMEKVVQRYPDLNLSVKELLAIVNIHTTGNQIITLDAYDYSYDRAANVVNAVTEVVKSEIPKIMKVENIEILYVADPDDVPVPLSQLSSRKVIFSFIISAMIAVSIVFLLEFMDDRLKTKREIQSMLGLPVFSMIPEIKPNDLKALRKKSKAQKKQMGDSAYATIGR
jgi:capsular polysaccharide biosynthesis protein